MSNNVCGIVFKNKLKSSVQEGVQALSRLLDKSQLLDYVEFSKIIHDDVNYSQKITLSQNAFQRLMPDFNTMNIANVLGLNSKNNLEDLTTEILVALLGSPIEWVYKNYDTLESSIKVRENIVVAAGLTALDFKTTDAERPEEYWTYHEDTGFVIMPGKSLIDGLIKATQPDVSGVLYSFSCYRATEYVFLLAIALEARRSNPQFLADLEKQWQSKAITAERFRDKFLVEYGSVVKPLPIQYYVPGDRIWFKNPDDYSSDVIGFEGSWVFYLGQGLFPNFWKLHQPFTLQDKCLEIYHWRHGVKKDQLGNLYMDEAIVEECVAKSKEDPDEVKEIMGQMFKLRDPMDIYEQGGCMDSTREMARNVLIGADQIKLDAN